MDKEKVWLDELQAEVKLYSEEDLQNEFRKRFPQGLTVTVRDESIENLKMYASEDIDLGVVNDFIGYVDKDINMLKVYGNLKAEMRIPVEDYNMLYADDRTWWSPELSDMGYETGTNASTLMMADLEGDLSEARLAIPCTTDIMRLLYIEGVPFAQVADLLKNPAVQTDRQLKEILALQRVYKEGITPETDVPQVLKPLVTDVEKDMQHMFGGQKPFREHDYYRTDVFPRFNKALQLKAEVLLMQRGVLPVEKHNLVVQFCNQKGDNWESKWMHDHYLRNDKDICDVERVGDRLVFSVNTLNPQKQVNLRHGLECSWAQRGVNRMPFERIADQKVYMATGAGQVMQGYVGCNQFTSHNYRMDMSTAEGSSKWVMLHAGAGNKYRCIQTADPVDFGADDSVRIAWMVPAATVEKDFSRITDVHVYNGQNNKPFIRCRIDGEQQMGVRLSDDSARLISAAVSRDEKLGTDGTALLKNLMAAEYFSRELQIGQTQAENRGVQR